MVFRSKRLVNDMENLTNSSIDMFRMNKTFGSSYHLLLLVLAILIIIANITVLYLFLKTHALQVGITNRLLANLAVSDLLTGLVTIPMTVASATLNDSPHIHILYFVSNVLSDFGTIYTVSSLCLVIYDRYVLVCKPFERKRRRTRSPTGCQIVLFWVSIFLIAALPLSWSYDLLLDPREHTKEYQLTAERIYVVSITTFFFFLPSCFVFIALILMLFEVKNFLADEACNTQQQRTNRAQLAVVIKFTIAFITFMFCWVPLMTIRILDYFFINISMKLTAESLEAMFAMRCATSLINPLIYTWNDRDYKKEMNKCYIYKTFIRFLEKRMKLQNQEQRCMV